MNLEEIQKALRAARVDGWLFFDHHERDPLAYRILGIRPPGIVSRRWYYFIPADGEPRGLVHRIESHHLDGLPGRIEAYSTWDEQRSSVERIVGGTKRVAMQWSPDCAIPLLSLVDGGTIDLIRSFAVEIASSADLVQYFEARWTAEQFEMHLEAGRRVDAIRRAAFDRIGDGLRSSTPVTEWDVQSFILDRFGAEDLFTDHGPNCSVNANAANPHYEPTAQSSSTIKKGDVVLIDLWAKLKRPGAVYYDITWMGYCGAQPFSTVENVFAAVRDARLAACKLVMDAVTAGRDLRGFQVDDAARAVIRQAGYGDAFIHRTGHSIGEDVHGAGANMDNLETHDERSVIPGTCFSVEPGVYLPDFGVRSEVNMFIAERQAMVTGEEQNRLVLIGA